MTGVQHIFTYTGKHRKKLFLAFGLILASVVLGLAPYIIAYDIVLHLIRGDALAGKYIMMMSGLVFIFMTLKNLCYYWGLSASHDAAYDTLMGMRVSFADKMMSMPLGDISWKGGGSFKKNIVDDIDSMEELVAHILPEGLPYIIAPLLVFFILLCLDWRLGLLSMGSIPFGIIPMVLMMKAGTKRMNGFYRAAERMNAVIVEYVTAMNVIKIFGRTTDSFNRYVRSVKEYRDAALGWRKSIRNYMAVYTAVLPCTLILLLPVGCLLYMNGSLALDRLLFSIMLSLGMGGTLIKLLDFLPALPILSYKIRELEKTFQAGELVQGTDTPKLSHYDITFEQVSFSYGDQNEKEAVSDVSFTAHQGSLTAIVGESGSGKSTLAKLLVHYWDVKSGTIRIGGKDITTLPLSCLMTKVAYVSQDTFLFNTTIGNNIRMGNPHATDPEVLRAAKLAMCHDFISAFENGYDTRVGDAGDRLSGGEKQRITIARAILKDAPVIVLDEATAFTDPENEDCIQSALNELIRGKTVIVIAHRLSTITGADRILVMDRGRLAALDTHDELLASCNIYRKLWASHQAAMDWRIRTEESADA
ncbi:MAG: ABC transporter ATP-binding protein/permease [Desulfobacterales bacterium]|nr:ABC transporter ATP-binding protein/permease [Desulfobacterales bacterium]